MISREQEVRKAHELNRKRISKLYNGYTSLSEIRKLLYQNDQALENELRKIKDEEERRERDIIRFIKLD